MKRGRQECTGPSREVWCTPARTIHDQQLMLEQVTLRASADLRQLAHSNLPDLHQEKTVLPDACAGMMSRDTRVVGLLNYYYREPSGRWWLRERTTASWERPFAVVAA